MNIQHERGRQGFTLIEIMVALFLLVLVVAAVYSTWMAVVRGSKTGRTAAAEVQRSRIAMRTLEEALTSLRSFAGDPEYYSFEAENGNKASLSFVSHLSKSFPRSGRFDDQDVRRVTFSVEPGPDSDAQLVLRQNPILRDLDIDEKEHPVVLAKNIKKFEMEFWDTRSGDWVDEWTQTNQVPPLIKFTLQFGGKEYQAKAREAVTREIAIPAITVPAAWQTPGRPAGAQ